MKIIETEIQYSVKLLTIRIYVYTHIYIYNITRTSFSRKLFCTYYNGCWKYLYSIIDIHMMHNTYIIKYIYKWPSFYRSGRFFRKPCYERKSRTRPLHLVQTVIIVYTFLNRYQELYNILWYNNYMGLQSAGGLIDTEKIPEWTFGRHYTYMDISLGISICAVLYDCIR